MKKICLILIIISLCGCNASYDLEINKDEIKESIKLNVSKEKMSAQMFSTQSKIKLQSFYSNLDDYYKLDTKEYEDSYLFDYRYNFNYKNFDDSFFLKSCYSDSGFSFKHNIISIDTTKEFLCLSLDGGKIDSLTVNIKTKYKVLDNNADSIRNNVYTWNVNDYNYQNKPIMIKVDTSHRVFSAEFYITLSIISVILLIAVLLIVRRIKNKDRI